MNWTEFVEWLGGYPKMVSASTEIESYQMTESWNRDMHNGSNYKEGDAIIITATPFMVSGISEQETQEKLISEVIEAIGDGSEYRVWIRVMPEVTKRKDENVWDGYARIAYKLKSELRVQ